ncbi:hypothetical protein BST61_g4188 [Cercospora zeina]
MSPQKRKPDDSAHGQRHTKKPKIEPAINRVPQEIWDNILQPIWYSGDMPRTFWQPKKWLLNVRLASKVFYNSSNEAFIRQNFQSPCLKLIAHDIQKFLGGLDLVRPRSGRPIESYIKSPRFFDHRTQRGSGRVKALPPLSPADVVALRTQLQALVNRLAQVQKVQLCGISSKNVDNRGIAPTEAICMLVHLFSQAPNIRLTAAGFIECDIDFKLLHSFLTSQPNLESLEIRNVHLDNGLWPSIFAYWRDSSPNLTRLDLYLIGDTNSSWGPRLYNDWAIYNGPFPIRAFRNPASKASKKQVESYSLHPSAGIVAKGRFAVMLATNVMLGNKRSTLFDPSITVSAFKERGLLL